MNSDTRHSRARTRLLVAAMLASTVVGGLVTSTPAQARGGQAAKPDTALAASGAAPAARESTGGPYGSSSYAGGGASAEAQTQGPVAKPDPNARPAEPGVRPESVIGADSRTRVNPTTTFPYRATALVNFKGSDGATYMCTAWFIGKDTVATAGHCVADGGSRKFNSVASYTVWPGANATSQPYGSCKARNLYSVVGWVYDNDSEYDYAAIKLNCTVGNTVGWYGMYWQTATLTGKTVTISGYPADKSPANTQWKASGKIESSTTRKLSYSIDTSGGQSGSAIVENRPAGSAACAGQCSMGIHTYSGNSGTRITQGVFDNLKSWKDAA